MLQLWSPPARRMPSPLPGSRHLDASSLEVPDGRRITTLVNATPIRTDEGEVESVIVTLQDLTPR